MKIGYTNSDIEAYLATRREVWGSIWHIVAVFNDVEWRNFMAATTKGVNALRVIGADQKTKLKINGLLFQVLQQAKEEKYKDANLIQTFIQVCGDQVNPTMSILPLSGDKIAVIFVYSRKAIKENLSPRRNINVKDSM